MAYKLAIRGWPHDPICKLCKSPSGDGAAPHYRLPLLDFGERTNFRPEWGILVCHRLQEEGVSINDWWDVIISKIPKDRRREASRAIMYSVWRVWRERNILASFPECRTSARRHRGLGKRRNHIEGLHAQPRPGKPLAALTGCMCVFSGSSLSS
jgi:hypothetical protein